MGEVGVYRGGGGQGRRGERPVGEQFQPFGQTSTP